MDPIREHHQPPDPVERAPAFQVDVRRSVDDSRALPGLIGLLAVALAVRLFAWSQTAVLFNDGPIFLAMAEAIGDGRWADVLSHPYHPLYPALIAGLAALSIEIEFAAVLVSIAGGLLAIVGLYFFVRDAFDQEIAWIAAWMLALHPWAIDFSSDVMSDGVYCGVFMVAFALLARVVRRPALGTAIACGLAAGVAFLARPEGAALLAACAALLVVRAIGDPRLRIRAAWSGVALILAGLFVMGPLVALTSRATGDVHLTQKKSIARLLADPQSPAVRSEKRVEKRRLADVARVLPLPEAAIRSDGAGATRPERSLRGVLETSNRVIATAISAFRWEMLALAVIGLFAARSMPCPGRGWAIGLVLAGYTALLFLLVWGAGYVSRRHALPPWLPLIGYAALGARTLWIAIAKRLARRDTSIRQSLTTRRSVCAAVVVALLLGWGARDVRARRVDRAAVRAAAEWLAAQHPESGPVAAQKLRVAYYAGARFVPLPTGHDGRLAEQMRRRDARWIVIDGAKLDDHRGLVEGIGEWLQVEHTTSADGRRVLVLSVEPSPAR